MWKYICNIHSNVNFKTINEGKSINREIPLDEFAIYGNKYHINWIVDLRFLGTSDLIDNPEIPCELKDEKISN